jgi:hypothetical protein
MYTGALGVLSSREHRSSVRVLCGPAVFGVSIVRGWKLARRTPRWGTSRPHELASTSDCGLRHSASIGVLAHADLDKTANRAQVQGVQCSVVL